MRILLDENLDWRLERFLPGHQVSSVPRIGWAGLKNGVLVARAGELFEVFLADTSPLMTKVIALLPTLKSGSVVLVSNV